MYLWGSRLPPIELRVAKNTQQKVQSFIERLILFGICPALGLLLVCASLWVTVRVFQLEKLDPVMALVALSLFVVGLGLMQFSYILFFKKESKLSSGVLYVASIVFMGLGVFAALQLIFSPQDTYTAYTTGRAVGIFGIGLAGFVYAQKRGKSAQSNSPKN